MPAETAPSQKSTKDPAREEVEALLDGMFRTPIVNYDSSIDNPSSGKEDRQWRAVTEALRRGILDDPEMRQIASQFVATPLSERLPEEAVDEIVKVDERTARLLKLGSAITETLKLESVPDEFISPDIRNAPSPTKGVYINMLTRRKQQGDNESFDRTLEEAREAAARRPGITKAEKDLIARRYRYARDIKLLGLMAELYDQPIQSPEAEDGVVSHELSSGTRLVMTAEAFEATPSLLDPQKWESRHQLKDRVYMVVVDGKQYIMKERKTLRHTDTREHDHTDGLTSEREFEVARVFAALGTIKQGNIELHWEKPLGYVEFPDGYQFCMFEAESGMETASPTYQLELSILNSMGVHAEEFARIQQRAKEIYDERGDLLWAYEDRRESQRAFSKKINFWKKASDDSPVVDELAFREFAALKAAYIVDEARELLSQTMYRHGYGNYDRDGHGFRLRKEGEQTVLEIIGFDFEYYENEPEHAKKVIAGIQERRESGEGARSNIYMAGFSRKLVAAASYAMLEQMGFKLPPQR